MNIYTKEQKIEAMKFFEEGFSAREIFEVMEIPIGTLYRWKSQDPKPQQPVAESQELLQLRVRVEKLEAYVARIERSKAKRESEEEYTGFRFK